MPDTRIGKIPAGESRLQIKDLSVFYGERQVLKELSLAVHAGEVVALIGPNGAGKSTLVKAVSGVVPARAGHSEYCLPGAKPVDLQRIPAMRRARILAVVPQVQSMPAAFTVRETVLLGRTPYLNFLGQVSTGDEDIASHAMQKVNLLELADRRVGELSGGEQQRVLLARALAQSTPLLLLDEPTTNLDLHYQVGFMEMVRTLAHQDGLAVMVTMHDLNLAAWYADRMALLVQGSILSIGRPQDVLTSELISQAYQLPVDVIHLPGTEKMVILPGETHQPTE